MSSSLPTPDHSQSGVCGGPNLKPPTAKPRSQRILACVLCQQRKVKCDRKFPCANCTKQDVKCVPATQVRTRRRRFPERALLDQIKKYETIFRQHNIPFESLHDELADDDAAPSQETYCGSDGEQHQESQNTDCHSTNATPKSDSTVEPRNLWEALRPGPRDLADSSEAQQDIVNVREITQTWEQIFDDDHLLFGGRKSTVDIYTLHPEPIHIFRLWQIYLENVDPLLKVTHAPSMQARIIEAASNLRDVNPSLEALMFSIYCMAVLSLSEDSCQTVLGTEKNQLLTKFQFGCQQALMNARFLRTDDIECLTAFYLYLLSQNPGAGPRSLSSLLGIAIRKAERMAINFDSVNRKYPALEAELRRRLWWSLTLFDARIREMSYDKNTTLAPTWDCRVPMNVNDSDLRLGMREQPTANRVTSESLFAVVRSELGDFIRHTPYFLDFTNPALKRIARKLPQDGRVCALSEDMEERYLKFCEPENPLHFMTIWTTRGFIARHLLLERLSHWTERLDSQPEKSSTHAAQSQRDLEQMVSQGHYHNSHDPSDSAVRTDAECDEVLMYAFKMLECDTNMSKAKHCEGYRWVLRFQFPFVAYVHIVWDLKRRPVSKLAARAWEVMNENYEARFGFVKFEDNPLSRLFNQTIFKAWTALREAYESSGQHLPTPQLIKSITANVEGTSPDESSGSNPSTQFVDGFNMDQSFLSFPIGFGFNVDSPNHLLFPPNEDANSSSTFQATSSTEPSGWDSLGWWNVPRSW